MTKHPTYVAFMDAVDGIIADLSWDDLKGIITNLAETKQIIAGDGNRLIRYIDTEFKRFSAFRKPLKALTLRSHVLDSI